MRFASAGGGANQRARLQIIQQELELIKECAAFFFDPERATSILARLWSRLEEQELLQEQIVVVRRMNPEIPVFFMSSFVRRLFVVCVEPKVNSRPLGY